MCDCRLILVTKLLVCRLIIRLLTPCTWKVVQWKVQEKQNQCLTVTLDTLILRFIKMKIYLFQSVLIPLTNSVKTLYSLPEDEICTFRLYLRWLLKQNNSPQAAPCVATERRRGKWKKSLPIPFWILNWCIHIWTQNNWLSLIHWQCDAIQPWSVFVGKSKMMAHRDIVDSAGKKQWSCHLMQDSWKSLILQLILHYFY